MITAAQIIELWFEARRTTPYPQNSYFYEMLTGQSKTYRERLDEQPRNVWGEPIPRIAIIKANWKRLNYWCDPPRTKLP